MKKKNIIAFVYFLILSFIAFGIYSPIWSQQKTTKIEKKGIKFPVYKIKKAKMTKIVIGTESDGSWYWKVDFKNTGNVKYEKDSLAVTGVLIRKSGGRISSPVYPFNQELPPNEKGFVKIFFERCCDAKEIQFALFDTSTFPFKKLDGYKTVPVPGIRLNIVDLSWKTIQAGSFGEWTARIRNLTNRATKVAVQALALPVNKSPQQWKGIGGQLKVIPPSGEIIHKGTYHPSYKIISTPTPRIRRKKYVSGDHLKVELRFFHNKTRCGGTIMCVIHAKEIIIP